MKEITPDCRMVDQLVEQRLLNGGALLTPTAHEHIDGCLRCQTLYRTFSQDFFFEEAWDSRVPGGTEHRIATRLKSNLKPVHPLPPSWVIVCAAVGLFLSVSIAIVMGMKIAGIPAMSWVQFVSVSAFLMVGLVLLVGSLARQMRPGSAWPISQRWLFVLLIAGLGAVVAALFPWRVSGDFVARGWQCLRAELLLAGPAALAAGYLVSRGAPLDLNWTAATVGAIAGWFGLTVLQYTCDLQNAGHLLVWHLSVVMLSTLVGAAIGHFLARRPRSL